MNALVRQMKWVLIVCGALTATMVQGVVAPQSMLVAYFGAGNTSTPVGTATAEP